MAKNGRKGLAAVQPTSPALIKRAALFQKHFGVKVLGSVGGGGLEYVAIRYTL